MTARHRGFVSGLALAAVLAAIPSAKAEISKIHDRKFPVGAFCPLESRSGAGADLSFIPAGTEALITFSADNMKGQCARSQTLCLSDSDCPPQENCDRFCGDDITACDTDADCNPGDRCGQWNHFKLDNVTVVPKSVFDQFLLSPSPFYGNCYDDQTIPPGQATPGVAEAPSFNFNAAGTAALNLFFDAPADLAGWSGDIYFDPGDPAPRFPAGPNFQDLDLTGGSLSIGQIQDGTRPVSASILVGGLQPNVPYVVFAWWSINKADTMRMTIETGCPDLDGDGHVICGGCPQLPGQVCGDCNDANPHCSTSCTDSDADGWCAPNDCNDAVATCNQDCTTDVDADGRVDCLDTCIDPDGDGYGAPGGAGFSCAGSDCLEGNPFCNSNCTDGDSDGYCIPADCADQNHSKYPGAPEVNDCMDEQCPGDPGFGIIDETSGDSGFLRQDLYAWTPQVGATSYRVVRSDRPTFPAGCAGVVTSSSSWSDPTLPPRGTAFFYLNRPIAPCLGSWGRNSAGQERTEICAGEVCNNGIDDDGDGNIDCGDTDCAGSPACNTAVFSFVDTFNDDIPLLALHDFFQGLSVGPTDHILFEIDEPFGQTPAWCSTNAAFYRGLYLSAEVTGGTFFSGPWAKWRRSPFTGNMWMGPDFGSYANSYGFDCFGPYSWCSERFPEVANCIQPAQTDICEVVDQAVVFDCNVNTGLPWTVLIRTASSRQAACGF